MIAAHLPSVTGEMVKQKSTANTQNICVVTTNCKNPEAIFKIMNLKPTYVVLMRTRLLERSYIKLKMGMKYGI